MGIPVFESENSVQFTFVSSVAPDSAPLFSVTGRTGTVVASFTSATSNSTSFYALYTMPTLVSRDGQDFQVAKWTAVKTVNNSAYNFVRRIRFKVKQTSVP